MPKGKKKPVTPPFAEIPVSTKTVIGLSNSTYDIAKMFELLPVAPYTVVPKKEVVEVISILKIRIKIFRVDLSSHSNFSKKSEE